MNAEGIRVSRSYTMTVDAPALTVFPLLCPVREYDWIDVWECEMVYSESGVAEEGCVFLTELPGRGVETWVVTRYQPARAIEFCRTAGVSRTCHVRVSLEDNGDGTTTLNWAYSHTAIDEVGRQFVEAYSADRFQAEMEGLEARLQHYVSEGEMLRTS
jgi:hypothetical protein